MKNKPTRKDFQQRLEQMVGDLRNQIMTGLYAPGEYLPSETSLVNQYHLSNKSIRKGLDQLVEEGLIIKKHRIGSMVTDVGMREKVTITLGCSPSIERDLELQKILHDFQRDYPNIQVKTVTIASKTSYDYFEFAQQYLDNGMIDILTMNHLNYQQFIENGRIHLFEPFEKDERIYPFLNEAFSHNEQLYVQPIIFSPLILCYNKDHFRDADLLEPDSSWTWEDAAAAAQKLSQKGRHGLYFHLLSENQWPVFLLQSGMTFERNDQGRYQICKTKLMEGIRLSKSLIKKRSIFPHYLLESNNDTIQLFAEGKVSMVILNYMSINDFKSLSLNYDISPLPFIYNPTSTVVAIGVGVNRHSREKESAKRLVQYLASEKTQRMIRKRTLSIPSMKPIAESQIELDEPQNRPANYALFRGIMPSFKLHRDLNLTIQQLNVVRNLLKMYWSDLIDEQALCNQLEEKLLEEKQKPSMASR